MTQLSHIQVFVQENGKRDTSGDLYASFHSGIIHNSQGVEIIQVSLTDGRTDTQTTVLPYDGMLWT